MSGFQFVGLILENSVTHLETQYKVAYFILSIGFILSLFGSLLSYITFKYLRSIKYESSQFVIQGMNRYYKFFMLTTIVARVKSMCAALYYFLVFPVFFNNFYFLIRMPWYDTRTFV